MFEVAPLQLDAKAVFDGVVPDDAADPEPSNHLELNEDALPLNSMVENAVEVLLILTDTFKQRSV